MSRDFGAMAPNPEPPEGANAGCPGGPGAAGAGQADACAGCPNQAACRDGSAAAPDPDLARIARRLAGVKHKLLVLSGKVRGGAVAGPRSQPPLPSPPPLPPLPTDRRADR